MADGHDAGSPRIQWSIPAAFEPLNFFMSSSGTITVANAHALTKYVLNAQLFGNILCHTVGMDIPAPFEPLYFFMSSNGTIAVAKTQGLNMFSMQSSVIVVSVVLGKKKTKGASFQFCSSSGQRKSDSCSVPI